MITPAQALTTLNAYFPVNNKANDTNDVALYDTIEAGSVAYEDSAYARLAAKAHLAADGHFTGAEQHVYVPYQTSYPAG